MKSLVFTLCLFCILILCIITNSVFLNRTSDYILEATEELQSCDQRGDIIRDLEEFWFARQDIIALTVPKNRINSLYSTILCLRNANSFDNEIEFERYRLLLAEEAKMIGNY